MSAALGILLCSFAYAGIRQVWWYYRSAFSRRWHRPRALLLRAPGCVAGGPHERPWRKHDDCGPACPWSPLEVRRASEPPWSRNVPLPERPERVRR